MLRPGALAAVVVAALATGGCGGATPVQDASPVPQAMPRAPPNAAECGRLAGAYLQELPAARACTPGVSQCTAWRPIGVYTSGSTAADLCWVAYANLLDPDRTAALDRLLEAYVAAGCIIGFCPGPGPHDTACIGNAGGTYSCGWQ